MVIVVDKLRMLMLPALNSSKLWHNQRRVQQLAAMQMGLRHVAALHTRVSLEEILYRRRFILRDPTLVLQQTTLAHLQVRFGLAISQDLEDNQGLRCRDNLNSQQPLE